MRDSSPTTDLDLEPIVRRASMATRGPWKFHFAFGGAGSDYHDNSVRAREGTVFLFDVPMKREREDDARFIAAARTDVPDLVAEVRRHRVELAILREVADACDRARKCYCNQPTCEALEDAAVAFSKLDAFRAGVPL